MEKLAPEDIAKMLGHDPAKVSGTQDWVPDTHPHLTISQIVVDGEVHHFRVRDRKTGIVHSKINEGHIKNPRNVDQYHAAIMEVQLAKNFHVTPALYAAIPSLDPANDSLVELKIGGRVKHATLAKGQITDIRDPTPHPEFLVEDEVLVVDISAMNDADKVAAKSALAKVAAKFIVRG